MSEPKILPAWLDADAAALAGAEPPAQTLAGALPGLARAQSWRPFSGFSACGSRALPRAAVQASRSLWPGASSCAATGRRRW